MKFKQSLFNFPMKPNRAESHQKKNGILRVKITKIFPIRRSKNNQISLDEVSMSMRKEENFRLSTWFWQQCADSSTFCRDESKNPIVWCIFLLDWNAGRVSNEKITFPQSICDDLKAKPRNNAVDNQSKEWILHNFQLNFYFFILFKLLKTKSKAR